MLEIRRDEGGEIGGFIAGFRYLGGSNLKMSHIYGHVIEAVRMLKLQRNRL